MSKQLTVAAHRDSLGAGQPPSGQVLPPTSGTPWTLATPVLLVNVLALGGSYESENRNERSQGLPACARERHPVSIDLRSYTLQGRPLPLVPAED